MSAKTEKKNRQAAREAGTDKKAIAAAEEAKKNRKSKIKWRLALCGIALLVVLTLLLNSSLIYKTTAYTVNGQKISAAEMSYRYASQYNYFVNQYGSYVSLFGLDTSGGISGLASQSSSMIEGTWRDYFIQSAEDEIIQSKILCDYADENGITLDEEELAAIDEGFEGIDEYAKSLGYANKDKYLSASFGNGVTEKVIRGVYKMSELASKGYDALSESFQYTGEELSAQYDSYNGEQDSYDYIYYYIPADTAEATSEDGTAYTQATEETRKEASDKANDIISRYSVGTGDYETRINAAVAAVFEGESAYTQKNVKGSSLSDYKTWVMDESRKAGDITSIENSGETGRYIVVFLGHSDNNYKLAQVRHILIKATADENGVYTDEAKSTALAIAQAVLDEFDRGDKTEESFAALAETYSDDTGSASNGGLYDSVYKGMTVTEFDEFCFAGHKPGDTAIVYGESSSYAGYHVMYYVGEGQNYRDYIAENDLRSSAVSAWVQEKTEAAVSAEGFGMKFVG